MHAPHAHSLLPGVAGNRSPLGHPVVPALLAYLLPLKASTRFQDDPRSLLGSPGSKTRERRYSLKDLLTIKSAPYHQLPLVRDVRTSGLTPQSSCTQVDVFSSGQEKLEHPMNMSNRNLRDSSQNASTSIDKSDFRTSANQRDPPQIRHLHDYSLSCHPTHNCTSSHVRLRKSKQQERHQAPVLGTFCDIPQTASRGSDLNWESRRMLRNLGQASPARQAANPLHPLRPGQSCQSGPYFHPRGPRNKTILPVIVVCVVSMCTSV